MTTETQKAGKIKKVPKLTRAQIKEGLEAFPMEHLLGIPAGAKQLTKKQRDFAEAVALGQTKAQAYRNSYKANPAPSTIVTAPYTLAADPRVKREIEAFRVAIEASKHRTPGQLREHLIHQLVQHSINPETPPAQQIKALELIGRLYEVGAFEERRTTTVIHKSENIKRDLIDRIKQVIDVQEKPARTGSKSLLAEIMDQGSAPNADSSDPTQGPAPAGEQAATCTRTHTIPLIQSDEKSNPLQSNEKSDPPSDSDPAQPPPSVSENE